MQKWKQWLRRKPWGVWVWLGLHGLALLLVWALTEWLIAHYLGDASAPLRLLPLGR